MQTVVDAAAPSRMVAVPYEVNELRFRIEKLEAQVSALTSMAFEEGAAM